VPAPSHVPSVPQLAAPWSAQAPCGSAIPAGTGAHRPGDPATLQARQGPHASLSQQTPSVQWPLAQSTLRVQVAPLGRRPQAPPRHMFGGTQSASLAHEAKQLEPLQA